MRIELNRKVLEPQQQPAVASDAGDAVLKPLLGKNNLTVTDLNAEIDRLALETGNARESSKKASFASVLARAIAVALESVGVTSENMKILNGVSEMISQIDAVSNEIAVEENATSVLGQEISELRKSNIALEVEIQKTEAQIESLKKMNEKTIDQKRKLELKKELARLENELASLNASHSANLSAISSKTALLSAKNARIEELKGIRANLESCVSSELLKIKDVSVLTALARALKSEITGERLEDEDSKKDDEDDVKSAQDIIMDCLVEEAERRADEFVFNEMIASRKENNV